MHQSVSNVETGWNILNKYFLKILKISDIQNFLWKAKFSYRNLENCGASGNICHWRGSSTWRLRPLPTLCLHSESLQHIQPKQLEAANESLGLCRRSTGKTRSRHVSFNAASMIQNFWPQNQVLIWANETWSQWTAMAVECKQRKSLKLQ